MLLKIFEIEREISLSTLDFSLESETLVNACFLPQHISKCTPVSQKSLLPAMFCRKFEVCYCRIVEFIWVGGGHELDKSYKVVCKLRQEL